MYISECDLIKLKTVYYYLESSPEVEINSIPNELKKLLWDLNLKDLSIFNLDESEIKEIDLLILEEKKEREKDFDDEGYVDYFNTTQDDMGF